MRTLVVILLAGTIGFLAGRGPIHRLRALSLPFVSEPVSTNATLSHAIEGAFRAPLQSLAIDSLIVDLATGLMAGERHGASAWSRDASTTVPGRREDPIIQQEPDLSGPEVRRSIFLVLHQTGHGWTAPAPIGPRRDCAKA